MLQSISDWYYSNVFIQTFPGYKYNSIHNSWIVRDSLTRIFNKTSWVNDEVINFMFQVYNLRSYIQSIHHMTQPDYFMNSFFISSLMGDDLKGYYPEKGRKWLGRSPFPNLFTKYRRVFIPVNYQDTHWSIIMIDLLNRKINTFDSMDWSNFQRGKSPSDRVFQFITLIAEERPHTSFYALKWKVCPRSNDSSFKYPHQNNDFDCGVYCIVFADVLSTHLQDYYYESQFNLCLHVSDELIMTKNVRYVIFALIILFNKDEFLDITEDANDPEMHAKLKSKSPSSYSSQQNKLINWDSPTNPKLFDIDKDNKWDKESNAIDIDINIMDESYECTESEFIRFTIHNKFLYLQKTRSSFVNNFIHQFLKEESNVITNLKTISVNGAFHQASTLMRDKFKSQRTSQNNSSINHKEEKTIHDIMLFCKALQHNMTFDLGFRVYTKKRTKN